MSRRSSQSRKARLRNLHNFRPQPSSRRSSFTAAAAETSASSTPPPVQRQKSLSVGSGLQSRSSNPMLRGRAFDDPTLSQSISLGACDRVDGRHASFLPRRERLVGGAPEDDSGWGISDVADHEAEAETGLVADYDESTWDADYNEPMHGNDQVDHELMHDDGQGYKQWVGEEPSTELSPEEIMANLTAQDRLDAEMQIAEEREIMKSATAIEAIREASKPLEDWDISWPGEALENGLPATAGVAASRAIKDPPLSRFPPGEPLSREFIVVIPEHAPADLGLRWRREVWPPEVDVVDLGYASLWEGVRAVRPGDQLVQIDGERTALSAPPRVWQLLVQRPATYLFRRSILGHLEKVRHQPDGSQAPQQHVGPAWHRNFVTSDAVLFNLERVRDRIDHGQAVSDDLDDEPDESEWAQGILRVTVKDGKRLGLTFSREHHPPKVAKLLPLQMDWWHAHGVSEGATLVKINGKSVRRSQPSDLAKMLTVRPLFLLFKPAPISKDLEKLWEPSQEVSLLRKNAEIQMQNLEAMALQAQGAAELAEEARRREAERVKRSEEMVLEAEAAARKQQLEFEAQVMQRAEAAAELADKLRIEETERFLRMELEKQERLEAQMHRMHKLADVARAASIEDQRRVRLEEKAHVAEMKAENAVFHAEESALAFRAEEAEQEAEEIVMRQHAELRLAWAEEQTHEDFRRKIQAMQKELALLDEVRGDPGPMRPRHEIMQLTVTIFSALGLRDEDLVGRSDPFCECEIVGKPETKFQTRVVENTVNPIWNCEREIKGYEKGDSLVFTVYDKETRGSVRVGSCVLQNPEFHPDGFDGELVLSDAARRAVAVLRLRVQIPQFLEARKERVKVSVYSAAGLYSNESAGLFNNAFCLCKLMLKSVNSFKTIVVPQTNQPVWNHEEEYMPGYCTGDSFEFLIYHQESIGQVLLGKTSLACEQFLWDGFTGSLPFQQVQGGQPATLKVKVELRDLPEDLSGVSRFAVDDGVGIHVGGDEPVGLVFEDSPPVIVSIQPGLEDDWASFGVYPGTTLYKINGIKTEGLSEADIIELLSKRPLSLELDDVGDDEEARRKKLEGLGKFGAGAARRGRRKKRPPVKSKTELSGGRAKFEINSQVAMGLLFGSGNPPEVEGISPNLKEYWEEQGVRPGMALLEVRDHNVQKQSIEELAPLLNLRPLTFVLGPVVVRKDLVKITVVSASGLRDTDDAGKADPFCVVQVPGKPRSRFQTNVVHDNREPVWNYSYALTEFSARSEDYLNFSVYDHDEAYPELLGQTSLDLSTFIEKGFGGTLTLTPPRPRPGDLPTLTVQVEAPVRLGADGKPMIAEAASARRASEKSAAKPSAKPAAKPAAKTRQRKVQVPAAACTDLPGDRIQVKLGADHEQTGFRIQFGSPPTIFDFMPELKDFWESLGLQLGAVLLELNGENVQELNGYQVAPLLRRRPLTLVFQRPLPPAAASSG